MQVIKALGSIYFTLFLIASLAILLTVSTITESIHGTPFAQKIFYRAGWFDIFLSLLGLNILCSTLTRIPFKKHHTGFVITHMGILLLLIGSLGTRLFGLEGQIALFEGEHTNRMQMEGTKLVFSLPHHPEVSFTLKEGEAKKAYTLESREADFKARVLKSYSNAEELLQITEGGKATDLNGALKIRMESELLGFKETLWLIEKDPSNPDAHWIKLGPATLELATEDGAPAAPTLILSKTKTGEIENIDLKVAPNKNFPLFNGEFFLTDIRYIPHAKIVENQLQNRPHEVPFNPAVLFRIQDQKGREEWHTKFALFPNLGSLHGGDNENQFDLWAELWVPIPDEISPKSGARLVFRPLENGSFRYEIRSSKAQKNQTGMVTLGEKVPTGWMDWSFTVESSFHRAKIQRSAQPSDSGGQGMPAVLVSFVLEGEESPREWVFQGKKTLFRTKNHALLASLKPQEHLLPFLLSLRDFRKIDYPGTEKPKGFESDVLVMDLKEKDFFQKTIRMNKPLDAAGFRIFQSSYLETPEGWEGSVFTISKNPGLPLIYIGASLIFFGIFILFYIQPLSRTPSQRSAFVFHPGGGTVSTPGVKWVIPEEVPIGTAKS